MKKTLFAVLAATTLMISTSTAMAIPWCEIKVECGVKFPY